MQIGKKKKIKQKYAYRTEYTCLQEKRFIEI